ncbi:aminopeptidase [Lutibacter sp.]|uniref:aminopeptidase n=1 Tax=Lutibacter sp. TaxID=1925666 RepID=UPI0025BE7A5B|nr:aminopeptidase [Lutibacter sp.]MCF6182833.1 aminopeptidase [Lutibacter sp.]
MKKYILTFLFIALFCIQKSFSQNNTIDINAKLKVSTHEIEITQKTIFYNNSDTILNEIYFHNWANAYKDKNTPLAKRFVENYKKSFHFTSDKNRGNTNIHKLLISGKIANWEITKVHPDILRILLNAPLKPNNSVLITAKYTIKLPNSKFTGYGFSTNNFNLRYWYLTPAIFDKTWQTYSNLNMDDLYQDFTNFKITFTVPKNFEIHSDLDSNFITKGNETIYSLSGKNQLDVELNIDSLKDFITYNSKPVSVISNLNSEKLNIPIKTEILNRELDFIQYYLGKYPHKKILINKVDYDKNPVYGFNQLPSFIAPFSDTFEWDIKMFKIITEKYINNLFLFNKRKDTWLPNGLQTYLMIKYVEKFYPEVKAIGSASKLWGIRNFNLAKISFNQKYNFVHQFAARKNLDQALTMQADSLSNFNRKITNKYKAGIGLQYLNHYLGNNKIDSAIVNFSNTYANKRTKSNLFFNFIKTKKDLRWFKNDFLNTNKKIDYTIKKIKRKKDSLEITIVNKRKFTAPIELYGIKNKEIKYRKWLTNIDSIATITIPKDGFNRLSLNYESLLPECNYKNNWKNINRSILNRPLKVKFLKDIENPYYNELFYTPVFRFNYYDGAILGLALSNKTILKKKFTYKVVPSYSTKSKTFSGSYSMLYEYLPENKKVNKLAIGLSGSNYHYDNNLTYNSLTPYVLVQFKRKNLRDVSGNALLASFTMIDREKSPIQTLPLETNKYNVFNLSYGYAKPAIIEDVRLSTGIQIANKFSKISLNARYRKLTDTNRQFDFRFFAGVFLSNKTESTYFNFALDRPTDYLFQYNYLGRSETSGIFSQQIIINEGGFKSKLEVPYANEWLSTLNTSIGIWRWIEIYNDVGFVKNKNSKVYFAHENGIRLNFIQDILEIYFPFHSNLGWEISQPSYSSKIRFVLEIKPKKIYNFIRRGFY